MKIILFLALLISFKDVIAGPGLPPGLPNDSKHRERVAKANRIMANIDRDEAKVSNLTAYVRQEIEGLIVGLKKLYKEAKANSEFRVSVAEVLNSFKRSKLSAALNDMVVEVQSLTIAFKHNSIINPTKPLFSRHLPTPKQLDEKLIDLEKAAAEQLAENARRSKLIRQRLVTVVNAINDVKEEFESELEKVEPFSERAEELKTMIEFLVGIQDRAFKAIENMKLANRAAIIAAVRDDKVEDLETLLSRTQLSVREISVLDADGCKKSLLTIASSKAVKKVLKSKMKDQGA